MSRINFEFFDINKEIYSELSEEALKNVEKMVEKMNNGDPLEENEDKRKTLFNHHYFWNIFVKLLSQDNAQSNFLKNYATLSYPRFLEEKLENNQIKFGEFHNLDEIREILFKFDLIEDYFNTDKFDFSVNIGNGIYINNVVLFVYDFFEENGFFNPICNLHKKTLYTVIAIYLFRAFFEEFLATVTVE